MENVMSKHRIYTTSVASVYPHYLAKAEKKGHTKAEVDEIIRWLTGYTQGELMNLLNSWRQQSLRLGYHQKSEHHSNVLWNNKRKTPVN